LYNSIKILIEFEVVKITTNLKWKNKYYRRFCSNWKEEKKEI